MIKWESTTIKSGGRNGESKKKLYFRVYMVHPSSRGKGPSAARDCPMRIILAWEGPFANHIYGPM